MDLLLNILGIITIVLLAANLLLLLLNGAEALILSFAALGAQRANPVATGDGGAALAYAGGSRRQINVTAWPGIILALIGIAALVYLFLAKTNGGFADQLLVALLLASLLPFAALLLQNLIGAAQPGQTSPTYLILALAPPIVFAVFLFLYNSNDLSGQNAPALISSLALVMALALLTYILIRLAGRLFGELTRKEQESVTGWSFITPTLAIFGLFTFGAMIYSFFISFTDAGLLNLGAAKFVGFDTYGKVLSLPPGGIGNILNKLFYKALGNTILFSIIVVFFQTWLAIIFAVILNSKIRFRNFFRVTWYLPSVTASVVISLIFFWMYKQQGVINYAISWINDHTIGPIFGTHYQTIAFLDDTTTALPSIMTMNIFTTVPTFMVMFLAALQDIPPEVYEAAKLDGAGTVRTFFSMTLPLLRPIIFLVVVLGTIGTLQVFDQVYLMTNQGGPLNSTMTVAYLIYYEAFTDNYLSRAAAIGFILFVIIFVFFLVQRRFLDRDATA